MKRPLLILACSATKREREVFAYQVYDGPAFRTLRASGWPGPDGPDCRPMILSAEHGLLSAFSSVDIYDRMMDPARATELAEAPEYDLRKALFLPVLATRRRAAFEHFPSSEVFVFGGALYRGVVRRWEERGIFADVPGGVAYTSGGIGQQLGQLKRWLLAKTPTAREGAA